MVSIQHTIPFKTERRQGEEYMNEINQTNIFIAQRYQLAQEEERLA